MMNNLKNKDPSLCVISSLKRGKEPPSGYTPKDETLQYRSPTITRQITHEINIHTLENTLEKKKHKQMKSGESALTKKKKKKNRK